MYRQLGIECKKRCFHSTTAQYRNIKPGFFTSLLGSTDRNTRQPKEVLAAYPLKSSKETHSSKTPPVASKMLVRDFIDDSLYNPHYGYYSKPSISPYMEFEEMEQEEDYMQYIRRLSKSKGRVHHHNIQQFRYSLTELFKPWYGYAIAKYMVSEYKLNLYPHKDLIIFEMGGDNGRLMPHILDYIKRYEPSVYKRTQYNMIELSDRAVSPSFIRKDALAEHDCVQILNENIFEWDTLVSEQCFFLGMKVINHFAHDVIRYDLKNLRPHQGYVCVDEKRNYSEIFEPIGDDATIMRYMALKKKIGTKHTSHNSQHINWQKIKQMINSSSEMSSPHHVDGFTQAEYIPTKLLQFLEILNDYFPRHRLILTDYSTLNNTIEGTNAPLVQTAHKGAMVPCATYLMPPGWYDIVFPSNFEFLREMYLSKCRGSKAGNEKNVKVIKYDDFLERYGEVEKSTSKKGAPMRLMHQPNVKVILT